MSWPGFEPTPELEFVAETTTPQDNQLNFEACAKSKYSKLQQRCFSLRKLNLLHLDKTIMQLFYQSILQSVLTFLSC